MLLEYERDTRVLKQGISVRIKYYNDLVTISSERIQYFRRNLEFQVCSYWSIFIREAKTSQGWFLVPKSYNWLYRKVQPDHIEGPDPVYLQQCITWCNHKRTWFSQTATTEAEESNIGRGDWFHHTVQKLYSNDSPIVFEIRVNSLKDSFDVYYQKDRGLRTKLHRLGHTINLCLQLTCFHRNECKNVKKKGFWAWSLKWYFLQERQVPAYLEHSSSGGGTLVEVNSGLNSSLIPTTRGDDESLFVEIKSGNSLISVESTYLFSSPVKFVTVSVTWLKIWYHGSIFSNQLLLGGINLPNLTRSSKLTHNVGLTPRDLMVSLT